MTEGQINAWRIPALVAFALLLGWFASPVRDAYGEAEKAEVEDEERRLHFRCDIGKANLTRPDEIAQWFKLVSVDLENSGPNEDWDQSDKVGVVTPGEYPQVPEPVITPADVRRAQDEIRAGGPWREHQLAKQWVGEPIARALELDLARRPVKRMVVGIIKTWVRQGWLKIVAEKDDQRHSRSFVEAGDAPVTEPTRGGDRESP